MKMSNKAKRIASIMVCSMVLIALLMLGIDMFSFISGIAVSVIYYIIMTTDL